MTMTVGALWRYPVKSLAGELIASAELSANGVPGDRVVQVRGPEGVRTSRSRDHYRLLGLHATLGADGEPLIDGQPWASPEALELIRGAAGADAELARSDGGVRFDILPLLVATDGAVTAFGRDVRRLRPNILIAGVEGLAEVDWPGTELHIGEAIIRLDSLRPRCPMTTVDPDTLERDLEVLKDIARRFHGRLALNADVKVPGTIHVGDAVCLVRDAG
ncbi:MAG: MOSC domain-containing protein [Acidimicrobiia bacterium]|jgi:hypothetical protein|nr:MOSC domain-containing protein [Acidimicrobiia bacterium]